MKGFKSAIENDALENTNFRKVVYTSKYSQLVLMSLLPKEEIGLETHSANDQFFRVEKGRGKCVIDGNEYELKDGDAVVVPRGAKHNIINLSETDDLKLYTIYSPPHHKAGIVRVTKSEAEGNEEVFDGATTEHLPTRRLKMFTSRENESNFLFGLRWSARLLSAVSIGLILLFIFGEGLDVSIIAWEERGVLMLFPLGFMIGLLLGWQEELKGGALAVCSIAAFYFVYGLILNGSILQGWWFGIVALPGFLFLLYGVFAWASRRKSRIVYK